MVHNLNKIIHLLKNYLILLTINFHHSSQMQINLLKLSINVKILSSTLFLILHNNYKLSANILISKLFISNIIELIFQTMVNILINNIIWLHHLKIKIIISQSMRQKIKIKYWKKLVKNSVLNSSMPLLIPNHN
jgi:hypothetical protein